MPETAWATGGDPLNGFMQGFSVGALNHKGEKILGDDGKTELILGCDDVIVYGKYAGPIRYIPISEKGLESVHPEFDLLMIGRAVANSIGRLFANNAAKGGTNVVYQGVDKAGAVKYVGITGREPAVRFAEHAASNTARSTLRYEVIDGATGLTRTQARIWEQQLINQHGLGNLLNLRNSIASKYWWQYGITP